MPRFSAHDAERVFAERTVADDLSDDDARLARLFASMRIPDAAQPESDARMIASIASEIRSSAEVRPGLAEGSRRGRHRVSAKAAAFAFAAVLASGTAAAAATGSLPDSVQGAVATALAKVNITVPSHRHGNSHSHTSGRDAGSSVPANAVGPDATGNAEAGLCTAWEHQSAPANGQPAKSVAFSNLQHAAAAAGKTVADYCDGVAHEPGGGSNKSSTTTTGAPGATPTTTGGTKAAKRQNGVHGPPVSTPNNNGNGKSASAPGHTTTSTTPNGNGKSHKPATNPGSTHAHGNSGT
jgi:hypothetical protein